MSEELLTRASERTQSKLIRAMIFGRPGAGKTVLAATFPRPFFLDTDHGSAVFQNPWFKNTFPEVDPFVKTFSDPVDEHGLFTKATGFLDLMSTINTLMSEHSDEFDTLVIDSLTTTQGLAMNIGLEIAGKRRGSRSLREARGAGGIPIVTPDQSDYGAEMAAFEQFMNQLTALPKHIICIAHEREETNKEGQRVSCEPYLIGARVRSLVGAWFDEVWYLDTNNKRQRVLFTDPDHQLKVLKSRHGVPDGLINPTFDRIKEALMR